MIIPDVNMMLYAHFRESHWHASARSWWQALAEGDEALGLPWLVMVGFLRLSTHPTAMSEPLAVPLALETVEGWLTLPHVEPVEPGEQHLRILEGLIGRSRIRGNLINDAHIAALAIEHRAEVHTNDSDFARFPGLRWRNPLMSPA